MELYAKDIVTVTTYLTHKIDPQNAVLALDALVLDIDQVENLIKFCPTKEEMEMLKVELHPLFFFLPP